MFLDKDKIVTAMRGDGALSWGDRHPARRHVDLRTVRRFWRFLFSRKFRRLSAW